MKKLLLMALFFMATTLRFANAFQAPLDRDGVRAFNVQDVGVYVFLSTSEVPWLISGATQVLSGGAVQGSGTANVGGSSIAIYGILTSTFSGDAASYAYVELRSTNTANKVSELLVPPIAIGVSTSTVGSLHVPKNNFVVFDPPIVSADQVSVNISSALGALTTYRYNAAIFYRYLSTSLPEDVWFPNDDREAEKILGGASLYGVRASSGGVGGLANDNLGAETLDFTQGPKFMMTSSVPANQASLMLYGWSASSGSTGSWFEVDDATGTQDYTVQFNVTTSSFNFLPRIYPRTFGVGLDNYAWETPVAPVSVPTNFEFNFPWPIIARQGLRFTAGQATERFRLKARNRRALR